MRKQDRDKQKKQNIIVLAGGVSSEREISKKSGQNVFHHLDRKKYNVWLVEITKDGQWILPRRKRPVLNNQALLWLKAHKTNVVFICLHGVGGEDGAIQGLLESAGLPYSGSGVAASALAMDKLKSSKFFLSHKLKVPPFIGFSYADWHILRPQIITQIKTLIFPCIIKPASGGSSFGVSIVRQSRDLERAISFAASFDEKILAQKYLCGREVTCAVLEEGNGRAFALPPTEIIPRKAGFFDYKSKYTAGAACEITPPHLPPKMIKKIQSTALYVHKILGCAGMSRTDMIVKDEKIFVLELNTIPGMTKTSLLPQAATACGITFSDLLDKIILAAFKKPIT